MREAEHRVSKARKSRSIWSRDKTRPVSETQEEKKCPARHGGRQVDLCCAPPIISNFQYIQLAKQSSKRSTLLCSHGCLDHVANSRRGLTHSSVPQKVFLRVCWDMLINRSSPSQPVLLMSWLSCRFGRAGRRPRGRCIAMDRIRVCVHAWAHLHMFVLSTCAGLPAFSGKTLGGSGTAGQSVAKIW